MAERIDVPGIPGVGGQFGSSGDSGFVKPGPAVDAQIGHPAVVVPAREVASPRIAADIGPREMDSTTSGSEKPGRSDPISQRIDAPRKESPHASDNYSQVGEEAVVDPRIARITEIVQRDREAFTAWASEETRSTASVPEGVLRSLIPRGIFFSAEDPDRVQVAVRTNNTTALDFFVVERRPAPPDASLENPPPLDRLQAGYSDAIQDGVLGLGDYIFFRTNLERLTPEHMYLADYDDRPEIRGQGIARDHLGIVDDLARALGARYFSAEHVGPKVTYFTEKVGRVPLKSLPKRVQAELVGDIIDKKGALVTDENGITVKVLKPERNRNL